MPVQTGISRHSSAVAAGLGASKRLDVNQRYFYEDFRQLPVFSDDDGDGAPTGAAGDVNILQTGRQGMVWTVLGTQTILFPNYNVTDGGLDIVQDLTDNDGAEYGLDLPTNPRGRCRMVVGTDAGFFVRVRAKVADISETDEFLIGWRKAEAHQAAYTGYADYLLFGLNNATGDVKAEGEIGGAGAINVDSTKNWADGETHTLEVRVTDGGKVVVLFDGSVSGITQPSYTFTSALAVIPTLRYLNATGDATPDPGISLLEFEAGLLSARGLRSVYDETPGV